MMKWLKRRMKQIRLMLCKLDIHGKPIGGLNTHFYVESKVRMFRIDSFWKCPYCNQRLED